MTQFPDRLLKMSRRRLFATTASFALGASITNTGRACGRVQESASDPFSLARTVVLPRRLGRGSFPARQAIERKAEELAGMDLFRLPQPKVEALLGVADAVTGYYGIGDQLEAWAQRTP